MKILVTGGAGFIGSHLVDQLLAKGHEVVAVDNLSLGRKSNLDEAFKSDKFTFIEENLLNYDAFAAIFKNNNFEMVFHLAANSDIAQSHDNPNIDLENTFLTTYNTLKAMKENGVKKIVFASTSAIYGDSKGEMIDENYSPLFPTSHYGAGKLASEGFITSFAENYDIQAWITRFPNVVGERATHGVIFDFINKLNKNPSELEVLGNGMQYKPYLYVKDLVEAILFVWENTNEKINYYNIGVESRTRVKTIAEMVVEEMKLDANIRYTGGERGWIGDVPEFNYCLDKIHKLGWRAKISSDEAVKKSIKYILQNNNRENLCNL